ncbi:hypothetical protein [Aquilutibacter rugosus]|uniref:hypothetical protein n=1 Tax=Aquilutibacter rugosus TaxID=3115820 RepID=UPI002F40C317
MTDIPQPGSVWIAKDNALYAVKIVWADEKTVVYDGPENVALVTRRTLRAHLFSEYFVPKPHTITVAGVKLPEPLREAPAMDEWYWIMAITEERGVFQCRWTGLQFDLFHLKRGCAFRTEADAKAWFEFEVKQRGGEL